jgi:uncharacterized membrane protein YeaQ/YmgE (transglycosylase-associated protein family)
MIGMDLGCFAVLLIVSVVVSLILHYGFKYYAAPGIWSLLSKIVVGWIGAWLGSPVFGHWGPGVISGNVYIVPAILGAFALLIVAIDLMKTLARP